IAKNPQTVETLGSATVICVDKTGTLTRNLMQVSRVYDFPKAQETNYETNGAASEVLTYAMWASEQTPFDPMEQSIHEYFKKYTEADPRPQFTVVHDFPLGGKPPVMTHIFENKQGERIIACKGALEGVLRLCTLSPDQEKKALVKGQEYAKKGLRVLGVAKGHPEGVSLPEKQDDI